MEVAAQFDLIYCSSNQKFENVRQAQFEEELK
jgi:hypothetical protein